MSADMKKHKGRTVVFVSQLRCQIFHGTGFTNFQLQLGYELVHVDRTDAKEKMWRYFIFVDQISPSIS